MHAKWILLAAIALFSACAAKRAQPDVAPVATGMVNADSEAGSSAKAQRPALSTEVLPSLVNTVTLKIEAPLLQRPKVGSVILKTLAAGDTVQLLGTLDNADGQWRSVGVGDMQGWLRAAQVSP